MYGTIDVLAIWDHHIGNYCDPYSTHRQHGARDAFRKGTRDNKENKRKQHPAGSGLLIPTVHVPGGLLGRVVPIQDQQIGLF